MSSSPIIVHAEDGSDLPESSQSTVGSSSNFGDFTHYFCLFPTRAKNCHDELKHHVAMRERGCIFTTMSRVTTFKCKVCYRTRKQVVWPSQWCIMSDLPLIKTFVGRCNIDIFPGITIECIHYMKR